MRFDGGIQGETAGTVDGMGDRGPSGLGKEVNSNRVQGV